MHIEYAGSLTSQAAMLPTLPTKEMHLHPTPAINGSHGLSVENLPCQAALRCFNFEAVRL